MDIDALTIVQHSAMKIRDRPHRDDMRAGGDQGSEAPIITENAIVHAVDCNDAPLIRAEIRRPTNHQQRISTKAIEAIIGLFGPRCFDADAAEKQPDQYNT